MCKFCLNARVNHELTDDNDLSYHGCGIATEMHRFLITSGNGKPTSILFEKRAQKEWITIGYYIPKYCPECGRYLMNDYSERSKRHG